MSHTCKTCNKSYATRGGLTKHYRTKKHKEKEKATHQQQNVVDDFEGEYESMVIQYKCRGCQLMFNSKLSLGKHKSGCIKLKDAIIAKLRTECNALKTKLEESESESESENEDSDNENSSDQTDEYEKTIEELKQKLSIQNGKNKQLQHDNKTLGMKVRKLENASILKYIKENSELKDKIRQLEESDSESEESDNLENDVGDGVVAN